MRSVSRRARQGLLRTLLLGPFALLVAFWQSARDHPPPPPDVVLGMGGYVSFPGGMMGVAAAQPLVLHEQNAIAGLANRVLAYGADRILLGFPDAFAASTRRKSSGWAIRCATRSCALPPPEQRFAGRDGPLRLLVVGGSLGAQALNERVPAALALLRREPAAAGRAPGGREASSTRCAPLRGRRRRRPNACAFIDDMAARYAWADLVICRAGATHRRRARRGGRRRRSLVPLPGAVDDEQTANARFLVDARRRVLRAAARADAANASPTLLAALDARRALAMAQRARALGKPRRRRARAPTRAARIRSGAR